MESEKERKTREELKEVAVQAAKDGCDFRFIEKVAEEAIKNNNKLK